MYLEAIYDPCLSFEPPVCETELSMSRKLFKYHCRDTRIKYLVQRNTIDYRTYKKSFCVVDFFLNHINNRCFSSECINANSEFEYQIKHVITSITI
jgi:hypothetical protein